MKNRTHVKSLIAGACLVVGAGITQPGFANPEHGAPAATPAPSHEAKPAAQPAPAVTKPSSGAGQTGTTPKSASAATPQGTGSPGAAAKPAGSATATAGAKPAAQTESKPAKNAEPDEGPVDADKALTMLKDGNARWCAGSASNPNTSAARRQNLAESGQKPFASILTCSDSRLPVERLFDRGAGDVFVVRVAGNIAGDSEAGTLEYGLGHLKTPLLVVMGHTKCGAVAAAASGAELHGKVAKLVANCGPAVERAKRANPSATGNELVNLAVKENVWQTIFDLLKNSDDIRDLAGSGKVKVIGAVCDITTGKVEFLGEHPWQSELLSALEKDDVATKTASAAEHATHIPATTAPTLAPATASAGEGKSGH